MVLPPPSSPMPMLVCTCVLVCLCGQGERGPRGEPTVDAQRLLHSAPVAQKSRLVREPLSGKQVPYNQGVYRHAMALCVFLLLWGGVLNGWGAVWAVWALLSLMLPSVFFRAHGHPLTGLTLRILLPDTWLWLVRRMVCASPFETYPGLRPETRTVFSPGATTCRTRRTCTSCITLPNNAHAHTPHTHTRMHARTFSRCLRLGPSLSSPFFCAHYWDSCPVPAGV
jgi:hypothetical protein